MNVDEIQKLMKRSGIGQDKIKNFLDSQPRPVAVNESKSVESKVILEAMTKTELETLLTQRQLEKYGYTKFPGSKFNPDDPRYSIEEHLSHPLVQKRLNEVKWKSMGGLKPEYPGSYFTADKGIHDLSQKLKDMDDREDIEKAKKAARDYLNKKKGITEEEIDLDEWMGKIKEIAFPDGQSPDEKKKKLPVSGGSEKIPKKIDITKKIEIPDDKMLEPGWDKKIDDEIDEVIDEMSTTGGVAGFNSAKAWAAPGQKTNGGIEASKKLGFTVVNLKEAIEQQKAERPVREALMAALNDTLTEMGVEVSEDIKMKMFDELYANMDEIVVSRPKRPKSGIREEEMDETKSPNYYGRNLGKKYKHHQVDSLSSDEVEKEKETE